MSVPITVDAIVPKVISHDLFPNIYNLNRMPDVTFEDSLDLYPNLMYNGYGFPNQLTPSVDPFAITGPQKYEYRYTNTNGIDVVLRGTYNDVMSCVSVLNTNPPMKRDCANSKESEFVDLYGNPVDTIGSDKNHIIARIGDKTFSGSGILILLSNNSNTSLNFVLFRDVNRRHYTDLGGMIDKPKNDIKINEDYLFQNASKEADEESMHLFNIKTKSPHFVDIKSDKDNTYYRAFVYNIIMNDGDVNDIRKLYLANHKMVINGPFTQPSENRETDDVAMFDFNRSISSIKNGSKTFQNNDGRMEYIADRTVKCMQSLNSNNIFVNAIKNKFNSTINRSMDSFNTVTV